MTSDADRLAALEKQVGDLWEVVKALDENLQAIDEALARQVRSIRYMGDQVQGLDERIRSRSTQRREQTWNTRLNYTARGNPPA